MVLPDCCNAESHRRLQRKPSRSPCPEISRTSTFRESNATMNLVIQQCIHDPLIKLSADGQSFECKVAESYEQTSDTTWQFNIRRASSSTTATS